ncbi:MAG: hypothetical protein KAJ48_03370 [Elusimicrobiales bacterium]|nr:hypothetical protein [Elusimicrobiales bacterium]
MEEHYGVKVQYGENGESYYNFDVCLGFISQSQLFAFGKTGTALEQLGRKAVNNIQKSFDIPIPLIIKNIVGDETRKYKS